MQEWAVILTLLFTVAGFMACEFMPGTPAGSSTEAGDARERRQTERDADGTWQGRRLLP